MLPPTRTGCANCGCDGWGGGGMRLALPFGTFLALGALAALFAGDPLIAWYSQFF